MLEQVCNPNNSIYSRAQFAKRDNVFYQSLPVKAHDAFVIICQITSSPAPPPVQTLPKQPVPKSLIDTVGMLLDDPRYADVEFILPSRSGDTKETRRIFASKRLLERADYFHTSSLPAPSFAVPKPFQCSNPRLPKAPTMTETFPLPPWWLRTKRKYSRHIHLSFWTVLKIRMMKRTKTISLQEKALPI